MPDESGFGVLGYIFLIKRLDGNLGPSALNPNGLLANPDSRSKHFDWQARLRPHNTPGVKDPANFTKPNISSQTEIAFDTIISDGNSPNFNTPNFGAIGGAQIPHQSSHWYGNRYNMGFPVGGNYLCLDGHVEWRAISKASYLAGTGFTERVITGPAQNLIAFWW